MRVVPSSSSSSSSSSRKGGDSDDDDLNEKVAEVSENLTTNEEALRAKIGQLQERVKALRRTQSTPRKENFPATATAAVSVAGGAAIDERRGGAATTRSGGDERRERAKGRMLKEQWMRMGRVLSGKTFYERP